jgi:hypothetical protein
MRRIRLFCGGDACRSAVSGETESFILRWLRGKSPAPEEVPLGLRIPHNFCAEE